MFSCWINYGYVCHHSKSNFKFFILLNSLFSNFLSVNLFLIASCSIKKLFNYLPFPDRNYPSSNTDRRDNYVTNLQNYITCCNVTTTRINHDTINIVVRLFLFRICRWLELFIEGSRDSWNVFGNDVANRCRRLSHQKTSEKL